MKSNNLDVYILTTILLLVLTSCKTNQAQNSFKLLDKASVLIEKGKFKKAIKKIKKAERSDYCICGNCALQVNEKANLLRHFIYFESKEYNLAQQALDNIMYHSTKTDSLKVISYQHQYGKEYLSKQIDSSLSKSQIYCSEYFCYLQIPLNDTDNSMIFKMGHSNVDGPQTEDSKAKKIKIWKEKFTASLMYKMIKTG